MLQSLRVKQRLAIYLNFAFRPGAASKPERQEQNMLMYGMDGQGNPQYINEDVVSLLLQNPQAKKVVKSL